MTKRLILIVLLVFLAPLVAMAVTINVPVGDPTYELIDKLAASGLIDNPLVAQKPWSREYVARLVNEALENRQKILDPLDNYQLSSKSYSHRLGHKRFVDDILKQLSSNFKEDLKQVRIHPLSSISNTYTYLNNAPLPAGNALFHPLVGNRQGRQYDKGQNFYWETEHFAQISKYFSAYLKTQFEFRPNDETYAHIHNLYAKTGFKDLELEVGRDQLIWGEGLNGGLMFSNNPRGLDMVKLSSGIFERLWNLKATAVLANLGPDYDPDKPWLGGARVDLMPVNFWAIGFGNINEFGDNKTKKRFSVDTKFTSAKLRGTSIYGETYFDGNKSGDIGWIAGFYLPRLDYTGKWSLRAEYEKLGRAVYQDNKYRSGWALNKLFIGSMMGPDSTAITAVVSYNFSPLSKVSMNSSFIKRSNSTSEYHTLNIYSLEVPLNGHATHQLKLRSSFGWDYVVNKEFTSGKKKADFLGEIGLTMYFPEF